MGHRFFIQVILLLKIEHNYEEVFDLAHVWICNKCNEKRIRFYNVPPTEHQLGT